MTKKIRCNKCGNIEKYDNRCSNCGSNDVVSVYENILISIEKLKEIAEGKK